MVKASVDARMDVNTQTNGHKLAGLCPHANPGATKSDLLIILLP